MVNLRKCSTGAGGCSHHKTLLPNFYTGIIFEVCPRPTTATTTSPWGGREPSPHKSVLVSGRGVGDGMGRGGGELAPSPFSSSAGKRPGCTLGPCSDPGPFRGRPVPLHNPTGVPAQLWAPAPHLRRELSPAFEFTEHPSYSCGP